MRYKRPKISWKQGEKPSQQPRSLIYVPDEIFNDSIYVGKSLPTFTSGEPFYTSVNLEVQILDPHTIAPPHPYVRATYDFPFGSGAFFPAGSFAVYAGKVRIEEATRSGKILRGFRNSFIINGCRYLTANINNFVLVQ